MIGKQVIRKTDKIEIFSKFVEKTLMKTVELKNILIHRIAEINDKSFLQAIKTILDSKSESKVLTLTPEQRNEIIASKKEVEQGLYIENDELEKEIDGWLNTK